MKNLINEILEGIGLEKIKVNQREAKANKEPLKEKNKDKIIGINLDGERENYSAKKIN